MAKCYIENDADMRSLRRLLKRRGYVLRCYRRNGGVMFSIRRNTYRKEKENEEDK